MTQADLFAPKTPKTVAPENTLFDRIPQNITAAQRADQEFKLSRMACMMVDWFADRAFTCPDSLKGTIETYKGLIVINAHNAVEG
jgi:hypothetical protein